VESYEIKATGDLDKYFDSFRILFAFYSGNIENEEITYHRPSLSMTRISECTTSACKSTIKPRRASHSL